MPRITNQTDDEKYQSMKARSSHRNHRVSAAGRDIGNIPRVKKPRRKANAALDFRQFCESYLGQTFALPWSHDHLRVIAKIEQAVLRGGLFAVATPRGFGKSSLCEAACMWAILYGHQEFVCLIGSDESAAASMLDSIKTELEGNDLLFEDFPEALYPIRKLEGISNRCAGQLHKGKRTHITWTSKELVLPTIKGSKASGAIIKVAGITGRIRGMKHKRADGRSVRPTLVIVDDPQTDESARSFSQCASREAILAGAILGLAGPGKKISGIMPCTVIREGDMADSILDRKKHPEWHGERTKLIYRFPTDEGLWKQYAEIRADELRNGGDGSGATEFYRQNQAAMDAGAEVAWPERFNHDEISAVQHAMNLKLQDEAAFYAEYQNEPIPPVAERSTVLTTDDVTARINRLPRGLVPAGASILTAYIDVHQALLYYAVCAWESNFTGYVVDYGTFPRQRSPWFSLREARPTLQSVAPGGGGLEGAIFYGLESVCSDLIGKEWPVHGSANAVLRVDRCLIDANWAQSTEVVNRFCRQSAFASVAMPSYGRFVGASSRQMNDYQPRTGDRVGWHWRIVAAKTGRGTRYATIDINFWKTFVYNRLTLLPGDSGSLTLYGDNPGAHQLFAAHLLSERRVTVEAKGVSVDEWHLPPERPDNHWLDCVVGCAAAASMCGAATVGGKPMERTRISFAELQRRRQKHG